MNLAKHMSYGAPRRILNRAKSSIRARSPREDSSDDFRPLFVRFITQSDFQKFHCISPFLYSLVFAIVLASIIIP